MTRSSSAVDVALLTLLLPACITGGGHPRQLYPGDAEVRWPVAFTILPGAESSGSSGTALVVVGAIGLLLITTLGAVVLLRRRSLQER